MDDVLEKSAMRKIYIRLLPFAILSYFLAYVDRINVSFAALTMRGDLKMSAAEYGFAFGTFYWGYFIFEVPSNVIMEKVGARLWIARIMMTWGILAGCDRLGHRRQRVCGIVRFLLGVAEAGFFPGIMLYFTYWFPARPSCADRFRLPDRPADRGGRRRADFYGTFRARRDVGPQGLADHVYRRGRADRAHRHRHLLRADGPAGPGEIPDRGGKGLAWREAGVPSGQQRKR